MEHKVNLNILNISFFFLKIMFIVCYNFKKYLKTAKDNNHFAVGKKYFLIVSNRYSISLFATL